MYKHFSVKYENHIKMPSIGPNMFPHDQHQTPIYKILYSAVIFRYEKMYQQNLFCQPLYPVYKYTFVAPFTSFSATGRNFSSGKAF